MANLDIDLLKTFVAIADARSLTRAAGGIGRTQSALSMQVRRIEEITAGAVLHRTVRGVELTAHGEVLLRHARALLRIHDEALAELTGSSLSGVVRLGCPDDYCTAFLPALLREIAVRHPRMTVHLACAPTTHLRRMLEAKRIDLALISLVRDEPGARAVRREKFVWVGAADRVGQPHEPLVSLALSEPDTLDHQAARRALEEAGVAYRIVCESAGKDGLLAMVRAGIAVAVLTEGAVPPDLAVLGAAERLPALPSVGIGVASADTGGDTLLVGTLKALISERLAAHGDAHPRQAGEPGAGRHL
ncbi:LysR family transcriptional regulator [Burkholderia alba]|uniref:LysR family transcriptional regulator n=1 Tax=Burkholderia alba TaxID=2683677 RepID=UPI002B05BC39|nr:LysR family transcriptional regulator [Burkholderia alba]